MSRTVHPRRPRKSPARNALDVAFHLKNAEISLERLEGAARTAQQKLAVRGLRASLERAQSAAVTAREVFQ